MKPYYQDEWVTIYHGDCREILPNIRPGTVDVIMTDPVWPNAIPELTGSEDPKGLFREAASYFFNIAGRLIVILGCNSDPRFLDAVPEEYKFQRITWLRRTPPSYRGSLLYNADIAYVFGPSWISVKGTRVIPGEYLEGVSNGKRAWWSKHPAYRSPKQMKWLVHNYSREGQLILDPFAGVGGSIIPARENGRRAIAIEIEEKYCEVMVKRCEQVVML